MIALERLRPADVDEVAALSARCFPVGGWTAADLESELARDFAEVWVARVDDGPIAGYAVAWFIGDDGEILSIGTDPSVQRRGVGRALVRQLAASVSARGVKGLTLEVRASNEAARALYGGAGFVEIAVRRGYYADGEDARVMTWRPLRGARPG